MYKMRMSLIGLPADWTWLRKVSEWEEMSMETSKLKCEEKEKKEWSIQEMGATTNGETKV